MRADYPQCNAIHRSIKDQFKQAIVYGRSVKHQPQRVGLAHELADEDIGKSFLFRNEMVARADRSRTVSIVKR